MTEHQEPLTFFVGGTPIPQGSKTAIRHGTRARLIEANKRLKPWRNTLQTALTAQAAGRRIEGPFTIHLSFLFTPPQRPRYRDPNGKGIHAVKPDVDKLTRAVLDSLTAADIIDDDARCTHLIATKNYTAKGHPTPGVYIIIEPDTH
jgi:crossover junction endodeoxyribonuclease RusA|nr:MAG TPA: Endodeoxyribonuclease RusA [Caudoviricetes sp.]